MSQDREAIRPIFQISAPAKINLCLDIIDKDKSGYHKIQTVFCEYKNISDELYFFAEKPNSNTSIVFDDENLAQKAQRLVKESFNIDQEVFIQIDKKIPLASGLGGGSSNAAATLKALNKIWNLGLSSDKLRELGAQLGMDVPFFIDGGVALGTNFGEQITQLPALNGINFQVTAKSGNSTPAAFAALDLSKCGRNMDKTTALLDAIKSGDNEKILANLHNDFETIFPAADHLSGSGPSTFTARLQE